MLRTKANVLALEPIMIENDDDEDMMVGFYLPSLGSLRTEILEKMGELVGVSLEERADPLPWQRCSGITELPFPHIVSPTPDNNTLNVVATPLCIRTVVEKGLNWKKHSIP